MGNAAQPNTGDGTAGGQFGPTARQPSGVSRRREVPGAKDRWRCWSERAVSVTQGGKLYHPACNFCRTLQVLAGSVQGSPQTARFGEMLLQGGQGFFRPGAHLRVFRILAGLGEELDVLLVVLYPDLLDELAVEILA